MINRKYGVVYTPESLAVFTAELVFEEARRSNRSINNILDPASGECALLAAAKSIFGDGANYWGIDIDADAVRETESKYSIIHNDAIMPINVRRPSSEYWKRKLPQIDAVIANPPWSSEKIYDREILSQAGFSLINGQYDSYVLFMELSYNLLSDNGIMAFIIPDSLFDAQNTNLRKFLCEKTQICVIARLGEKIFDEVFRSATVIVCKKAKPNTETITHCFRLSTEDRKAFLSGNESLMFFYKNRVHDVKQSRFMNNDTFIFDIDLKASEEALLKKITASAQSISEVFSFGRGVEISKAGKIVFCPSCGCAQGYKKSQLQTGSKTCTSCGKEMAVSSNTIRNVISKTHTEGNVGVFVGEDLHRYSLTSGHYIQLDIKGINYKEAELYEPPKLCIRKTGLGIYCAIDYTSSLVTQTVYILKYKDPDNATPLEYYLAILNSRVVYYYYLKVYGENEWKSHPYLTKQIIFDFPIIPYTGSIEDDQIVSLSKRLSKKYDHETDIELENIIMKKYGLTDKDVQTVVSEMGRLPDLTAVNDMKMEI